MFNLNQINEHEQKKAKQQPVVSKVPDIDKPMVDNGDTQELAKSQRQQYVQQYGTWAEAQKRGDISEQEWANGQIALMKSRGENVGDYVNLLALMGNSETPEQIAKRERREALGETFRGLGNLIGNAANLYYANKSGYSMDLNSIDEKHRERAQQLKDKQDALKRQRDEMLLKYKIGDAQRERANEALKEERAYNEKLAEKKYKNEQTQKELQYQRDLAKLEIEHAFRMGQIDAKTAARMQQLVYQATTKEALEKVKHGYRMTENEAKGGNKKSTFTYGGKEYNKKDLAAMKELAKRLKKDHYSITIPEDTDDYKVKRDDFIKAILDAQKTDGVTSSYNLVDSDINDSSNGETIKYVPDDDDELEELE